MAGYPVKADNLKQLEKYQNELENAQEQLLIYQNNELNEQTKQEMIQLNKRVSELNGYVKAYEMTQTNIFIKQQLVKKLDSGAKLYFPASTTRITSYFDNNRKHPITGENKAHIGIDIAMPGNQYIYAAEKGTVIDVYKEYDGRMNGYGDAIMLQHQIDLDGDGQKEIVTTFYAHLMPGTTQVTKGDVVDRGQLLAQMGTSGISTGQHLHFEVHIGHWSKQNAVDPMLFLN
jgi:murein DD-endopeptidase MepM/ murein hydrolase activator NlpD